MSKTLLVAGRCISGTHEAHSSYRVMPVSMATGQAAGVCAALAARLGKSPRAVPVSDVQAELTRQDANLRDISKTNLLRLLISKYHRSLTESSGPTLNNRMISQDKRANYLTMRMAI